MRLLRVLILLLILPMMAWAQTLPALVSDRVNDFADLLPPETEARVAAILRAAQAETGVQVVLVTLDSLAAQGGADQRLQDYATALFNAWGVGDAARNDGILILVLRDDRVMRIALGAAYDPVWDNAAQRIIDQSFLPAFQKGRFADGIEQGVAAIIDRIARPFGAGQPPPPAPARDWAGALPFAAFCLFAAAAAYQGLRRRRQGRVTRPHSATAVHTRERRSQEEGADPAPDRDRTSGGSSSLGGGRSKGGGASGRW